jgi:penicillin G amidase
LASVKFDDPNIEQYAALMRGWDGTLSRASQAGPIYAYWLPALQQAVYGRHVPANLVAEVAAKSGLPTMLHALENPDEKWFGTDPAATRDKTVRQSFLQAVAQVQKRFPKIEQMRWGAMHTVTFRHALASGNPLYEKALNIGPFERTGDGNTPNNTRYDDTFQQIHGATYRHLFDLADWDKGLATSAPGQSAQLGSPHYADLAPLWAEGRYFPLAYSRKKVEEVTQNRLLLKPGS